MFQKFKSTLDPVGSSFPKKITCGRSRSCQRDGLPSTSLLSLLTHAEDLRREIIYVGRTALDSSSGDLCPGTRFGGRNAAQFKVPRVGNMQVPCQYKGLGIIGGPTNGSAVLKLTLNQ